MDRNRKWIYIPVLSVVGVTLLVLCVIKADARHSSVQFYNDIPHYESMLAPSEHPLHIAYEVQAAPLMEAGVVKAYRTDFIATMIIAVDRDRVEDEITGWSCLRTGDYEVYFGYRGRLSHIDFGYALLSMAAGLDEEDGGYRDTIRLLKYLHNHGRLISDDPSGAAVAIMFDYQAAQMLKEGRNIEIIVPGEGTLSFPAGVMSTYTQRLPEVSPADLLAAGFRLPNGAADSSIYPASRHYSPVQNAVLTPQKATQIISAVASFQRQVLGKRLFSPANGVENILSYFAFIIIIVLWSGMLYMRISDKALQQKLLVISALLLFWMLTRLIRLLLPDGTTDRFFWYLYYIPLAYIPTVLFGVGQILTQSDKNRFPRLVRKASFLVSLLLVLLVLTNDFHQMAFRFYRGTAGNNYDLYYSHGWVYYFAFVWSLFLIFAFVFMAVRKKTEPAARQADPLLLLLCLSMTYFGGYALGIPIFRESEFSIVYGIMTLLFLEVCFRNRLIPNNDKLGALLLGAPIEMHILSDAMQIEYKTDCAAKLPLEIVERVRNMQPQAKTPFGLSLPDNESILYGVYRINGGYSIFVHHLDPVIRLRSALTEQNERIKTQNSALARTHKVKGEIAGLQAQQELFTRVEGVLKDRVNIINAFLPALSANDTDRSKKALQKQLAKIKVLVNYCKRRGNLVLLEAGDENCETASLALWLQESLWEAKAAGIDGLVSEAGNTQIHSSAASLLYDCFEHILEKAMNYAGAVLLANLAVKEDALLLRVAVETAPAADPAHFHFGPALHNVLHARGASSRVREHDDGLKILISVPGGGWKNG